MPNDNKNTEETFNHMRSVIAAQRKENESLKRLLKKTNNTIEKTKKHLEYLKRIKIWTEQNLYAEYHLQ